MVLDKIDHNNYLGDPGFGCFKVSEACKNCYIKHLNTFIDSFNQLDDTKILPNSIVVVGTHTDFFLEEADHLRPLAGDVIKKHPTVIFEIYTKRVERIMSSVPDDGGDGGENVIFCITAETQQRANERLPILINEVKCKHKWINCAPLLEELELSEYLKTGAIESITTSGERCINGKVRSTDFTGMSSLADQCKQYNVHFEIMFLGNLFIMNNRILDDDAKCFRSQLAIDLNLNNYEPIYFNI